MRLPVGVILIAMVVACGDSLGNRHGWAAFASSQKDVRIQEPELMSARTP